MSDRQARRTHPPLQDALGKLCVEGQQLAAYLCQVPADAAARQRLAELLTQIAAESAKQGRTEMPRLCQELETAAKAGKGCIG